MTGPKTHQLLLPPFEVLANTEVFASTVFAALRDGGYATHLELEVLQVPS